MSTFCVFGITRAQCRKIADDKVPMRDKNKRLYTQEERRELVDEMARELFEAGVRTKQISPAFDTPHFAEDWIGVGLKAGEIRDPKVMVRGGQDGQARESRNQQEDRRRSCLVDSL